MQKPVHFKPRIEYTMRTFCFDSSSFIRKQNLSSEIQRSTAFDTQYQILTRTDLNLYMKLAKKVTKRSKRISSTAIQWVPLLNFACIGFKLSGTCVAVELVIGRSPFAQSFRIEYFCSKRVISYTSLKFCVKTKVNRAKEKKILNKTNSQRLD